MARISLLIAIISVITLLDVVMGILYVSPEEWNDYKQQYGKVYTKHPFGEAYAQYYYAYNKKMINKHNALYERGLRTYKLAVNQFTDMRFIHFKALFPPALSSRVYNDKIPDTVQDIPETVSEFNLGDYVKLTVEDQGINCNSGWAYAVAKCIELTNYIQSPGLLSPLLSAQQLIDCAGGPKACKNQVPQQAFDYLTQYEMDLQFEKDYKNNNLQNQPGMCLARNAEFPGVKVKTYSTIKNGDDDLLMKYVFNQIPVVVEYDPTSFEFMHYAGGIFQQPITHKGSHFMVVTGFGEETNGMKYWRLLNSFGDTWGEKGQIRIQRTPSAKLAKNAIFTTDLA